MSDALDVRDGPTEFYKQHHEVVTRKNGYGKRRRPCLEIMLDAGEIGPNEFSAGRAFGKAFDVGDVGRSSSSMWRQSGGGGGGPPDWQIDQITILREASEYVDRRHRTVCGYSASNLLARLCSLQDAESFGKIGRLVGMHHQSVRRPLADRLKTLAEYFDQRSRRDRRDGRPGTVEQIKKQLDPEDDR